MRIRISVVASLLAIFFSSLLGAVEVPAFFASNMVVQQNKPFVIWGTDRPKQSIKLQTSWGGIANTQADENGNWRLAVNTPEADHKPHEIVLTGSDKKVLSNVMLGELWFASGQSNMGMRMSGNFNQPIIGSNEAILNSSNPQLRLFKAAAKASVQPVDDVQGTWLAAQPATVKQFSATAYYFAAKLQTLLNVPVGIIVSAWGGTPVESWIDAPTLSQYADFEFHQALTNQPPHRQPSQLFNGMINPFLGLQIKGAIWYQGEANRTRAAEYKELFPAMVQNWRKLWNSGEFAFHFVQIAPFSYKGDRASAYLREAQLQSVDVIPNSGMAVTLDVGNCSQIHPAEKRPVGERLAYLALAKQYGMDVGHTAPVFKHADILDDGKVNIEFTNAPLGLTSFSKAMTEFELAGQDQMFYPAQAKIIHRKAKITVWSDKVQQPVAVRYAFKDCPRAELFGVNGLPISSFRSDNW